MFAENITSNRTLKVLNLSDNCITNDFLSKIATHIQKHSGALDGNNVTELQAERQELLQLLDQPDDTTFEDLEEATLQRGELDMEHQELKAADDYLIKHCEDDWNHDLEILNEQAEMLDALNKRIASLDE